LNELEKMPFWRFLGLAVKARRVITGSEAVELGIRQKKGYLVIIAGDAAQGSAEKIMRAAKNADLPVVTEGSKELLGHWTGKVERIAALVTDKGFAERLMVLASQPDSNNQAVIDKNGENMHAEAK
jgi:ribosomal protein L7Ae-like RNA K-turn-binding protein